MRQVSEAKSAIDIQDAMFPKASLHKRARPYAGLKTPERKPQDVMQSQE